MIRDIILLISDNYKKLNEELHRAPRGFGASGHRWHSEVALMVEIFSIKSWLDYGCGQSTLVKQFRKLYAGVYKQIEYQEYDPCIPKKSKMPEGKFDLVTCTDVLEHVEPKSLNAVLLNIYFRANKAVFLNINLKEANKKLPDGRNAHLIIESSEWWIDRIKQNTKWCVEEKVSARPWKDLNLWSYP